MALLSVLVRMTLAPGTTAPELSVTVPRIAPITSCAAKHAGARDADSHQKTTRLEIQRGTIGYHNDLRKQAEPDQPRCESLTCLCAI